MEELLKLRFHDMMQSVSQAFSSPLDIKLVIEPNEEFDIYASISEGASIVVTTGALLRLSHYFLLVSSITEEIMDEPIPSPTNDIGNLTQQRVALNVHLLTDVFDFLLLHELAHIVNGHLGLLQERQGALRITEAEFEVINNIAASEIMAFELDADRFAARNMANRKLLSPLPVQLTKWEAATNSALTSNLFAAFSAVSMFRIFLGDSSDSASGEVVLHPPDLFRMMLASSSLVASAKVENWMPLSHNVVLWSDRIFTQTTGLTSALPWEQIDDYENLNHRLSATLDALKPELQKFSYSEETVD